jgi:hypothetical protein
VTYGNEPDLPVDAFIDLLRRSTLPSGGRSSIVPA